MRLRYPLKNACYQRQQFDSFFSYKINLLYISNLTKPKTNKMKKLIGMLATSFIYHPPGKSRTSAKSFVKYVPDIVVEAMILCGIIAFLFFVTDAARFF
jgi:hypothetical protein